MGKYKFFTKYVGLPAALCGAIVWHGDRQLRKQNFNYNNENGRLICVSMFHRHGDRTVLSHLRKDTEKEHQIWVPILGKQYSPVRLNAQANDIIFSDNQPKGNIFQWNNIASRLQAAHLIHKQYNNDINAETYINSRNPNCNKDMTSVFTWDSHYPYPYLGQLTDRGVVQLRELGRWLRKRYINELGWLSPTYDSKSSKLYYISTNFARTIYSADSLLMGLYPLNRRSNDCHTDSSVPLHVDIVKTFLYANPHICKKLELKNMETQEYLVKHKDPPKLHLKQYLAKFFDCNEDEFLWQYFGEALLCRLTWDRDFPKGMSKDIVKEYAEYVVERVATGYGRDRETLKLSYGVLLDQLVHHMKYDRNKFVIHSAHDNTIIGLLVAISNGSLSFPWPNYASNIIFEVWEKPMPSAQDANKLEKKRVVRVFYEKRPLMWANGKEWMTIDELEQMWKDVMVDEKRYLNVVCPC